MTLRSNDSNSDDTGREAPLFFTRRGKFEARLFRGDRPKGPAGRYEAFANHSGFHVALWRRCSDGHMAPFSATQMEPGDYGDWEHVLEACYSFLRGGSSPVPEPPSDENPAVDAPGEISVEAAERAMIASAVEILRVGGDVRGQFLDSATSLLVRAGQSIGADRFVYAEGLAHFSQAEWDAFCQATHAATFACRLAQSIGVAAQEHIDSWLLDVVPALRRLLERSQ